MDIINADLYSNSLLGITGYIYILVIYYIYYIYILYILVNIGEFYRKISALVSFTANFNSKHVILQFITKFCWGVGRGWGVCRPSINLICL